MVEKIVGQVIANVPKDTPTIDHQGGMPIIEKDSMCKFVERRCQNYEEGRGHHKSIFVHG